MDKHRFAVAALVCALSIPVVSSREGFAAESATQPDQRFVIELDAPARAKVLGEMRNMLIALREIIEALQSEDMKAVAKAARTAGLQAPSQADAKIHAQVPEDFRKLGFGTHAEFDVIAADAERYGDPKRTLRQLSGTMQKCIACHSAYQVRARR